MPLRRRCKKRAQLPREGECNKKGTPFPVPRAFVSQRTKKGLLRLFRRGLLGSLGRLVGLAGHLRFAAGHAMLLLKR